MSKQSDGRPRGPVPACLEPREAASPRAGHQITSSAADSLALKKHSSCEGQRGGYCFSYITSACDTIPERNNFRKKRFSLTHPSRVSTVIVAKSQWQKLEAATYNLPTGRKPRVMNDGDGAQLAFSFLFSQGL